VDLEPPVALSSRRQWPLADTANSRRGGFVGLLPRNDILSNPRLFERYKIHPDCDDGLKSGSFVRRSSTSRLKRLRTRCAGQDQFEARAAPVAQQDGECLPCETLLWTIVAGVAPPNRGIW
jgi:hypothetical protein